MTKSRGAVLIISLILLLALTLISVTALQGATQGEHIASNTRQRNLAFQAAEAGLRAGEAFLSSTAAAFDNSTAGLRGPVSPTVDIATYWLTTYNWTATAGGTNAGSVLGSLDSTLNVQPRYVIELLFSNTSGSGGGALQAGKRIDAGLPTSWYRVTARGTGGTADAVVILQSIYRR
jgi:type IV pilus assembly protein PilX